MDDAVLRALEEGLSDDTADLFDRQPAASVGDLDEQQLGGELFGNSAPSVASARDLVAKNVTAEMGITDKWHVGNAVAASFQALSAEVPNILGRLEYGARSSAAQTHLTGRWALPN